MALQGDPQWPEISRLLNIHLRFPERCRPPGGSACRKISAFTKQGLMQWLLPSLQGRSRTSGLVS